ncbi:hypothetical protein NEP95_16670 [Escherichia coli]|nr:hypothetical protein [Escherichia coli]EFO4017539.1 hypothetical protein [Escherichia coli]MCT6344003.1 hypothetical protein [Escherichia coli]MDI1110973.1 hypothetical protein [Escherichia coli]MDI1185854.1 hypothetical protein [Escherichia coli]
MRKTWFYHLNLTTDEANQLITLYHSRDVKTTKHLSADPRLWIVGALLPEYASEPKGRSQYQQKMWS